MAQNGQDRPWATWTDHGTYHVRTDQTPEAEITDKSEVITETGRANLYKGPTISVVVGQITEEEHRGQK
jgi:hypothetical protein